MFLDAGFLSKLCLHFGNGKYIKHNILTFSKNASKEQNLFCKHIFYYTAPPFQSSKSSKEENKRKENYDNFIKILSKCKLMTIREGRCQRIVSNDGNIDYHQKGVDTLLTMDLMSVPIKFPDIKTIILVACDSDFVPIIENLKELGIETVLLTYFDRKRGSKFSSSNELMETVSKMVLINKENFENSK